MVLKPNGIFQALYTEFKYRNKIPTKLKSLQVIYIFSF